ncbi:MAG: hypothetical protein ACRDI2_26745, partial [Chloroflexota bacterium]
LSRDALLEFLLASDPPIELAKAGKDGVYVNPQDLRDGDEVLVAGALRRALKVRPESGGKRQGEKEALEPLGVSR